MKTFAILAALASVVALATAAEPLENDPAAHLEAAPAPGDAGAGPDDKEDFYGEATATAMVAILATAMADTRATAMEAILVTATAATATTMDSSEFSALRGPGGKFVWLPLR